ncbi:MAG TPA: hemagglutinin repeat-containing protein [Methylibium sp.]|uniref:two-partner secretion domain-containing protein n=1 Tax=Methylibium sp. TaxID=2067992 RepID=UPI002DBB4597|nr:hemagglutinin repeat-containing protein [Methylibium sp.]HEU4459697.1 hemagglutinin repeat-containing protein [Methylibium sp.]
MNAHLHRLVFNAARGVFMAVAETASARCRSPSSRARCAAFVAILALLFAGTADAQIVADPAAPAAQRPTVLNAANGVPLVNIQTPSAAGVSRNTYRQFDVDARGAILNNARTDAATQLGGMVQGNPWLATGSARVILNEVHSANPSQLRGFVEVAGARAQVVIANPAGISCDGCGFVNASRATLTTGAPVFNAGDLEAYLVRGGTVRIDGAGLDATRTDYTDVIARAVEVNAGLWANQLRVSTGANQVDAAHTNAAPITGAGPAPAFALDVSRLGGMYAGRIVLVGTEAGVGVRNAGTLAASGELTLSADGRLDHSGRIGATSVAVDARAGIAASGVVRAEVDARLATGGTLAVDGIVTTGRDLGFDAARIEAGAASTLAAGVLGDGRLAAAGTLSAQATQSLAAHGRNLGVSAVNLRAPDLDLGGAVTSGSDVTLATTGVLAHAGAVTDAARTLDVAALTLNNPGGQLVSRGELALRATTAVNNEAGLISAAGALRLDASSLRNARGQVASDGDAALRAGSIDNAAGHILARGALAAEAGMLDNRAGAIGAEGDLRLQAGRLVNTGGTLASEAGATLVADAIENAEGRIAANALAITTTGLAGAGRLAAVGDLRLSVGSDWAQAGTLEAGRDARIDVAGTLTNTGTLVAGRDARLTVGGAFVHAGTLQVGGDSRIDANGTLANRGVVRAQGRLDVRAGALDNAAGADIAAASTNLAVGAALTNRGVIDGADVLIQAGELRNLGTGRLYGDRLAIGADSLVNDAEGASAAVIAARERLDVGVVGTLLNREQALVFSGGDMSIGGALDTGGRAGGSAASIVNRSATIESLGSMRLAAGSILNTNDHFAIEVREVRREQVDEYAITGQLQRYPAAAVTVTPTATDGLALLTTPGGASDDFTHYSYERVVTEPIVTASDPSRITAGGDMSLAADSIVNDRSRVVAGGAVTAVGGSIDNRGEPGIRTTTEVGTATHYFRHRRRGGAFGNDDEQRAALADYAPPPALDGDVYGRGTVEPGSRPSSGTQIAPRDRIEVAVAVAGAAPGGVIRTATPALAVPASALFIVNPRPDARFLIETDPRFTDRGRWLGSDFMLAQLGTDPATTIARLGDGFYEQQLVREQVAELTGRRFLADHTRDDDQYRSLMNAGVRFGQAWNLRPGIALTNQQMAQLTTDIVWLVERTVSLPDGSTRQALVPQVYARARAGDLDGSGALISGGRLSLRLDGELRNTGVLAGREIVIDTGALMQSAGRITGETVAIRTEEDLRLTGGAIEAQRAMSLQAGRDLVLSTATSTATSSQGTRTSVNRPASLYVGGGSNGGTLLASAARNVILEAANVTNASPSGVTALAAGRDLRLGTVTETREHTVTWDANNTRREAGTTEVGSRIDASGDLQLIAARDLALRAAGIAASGDVTARAGRNLTIGAGQAVDRLDEAHQHSSTDLLRRRTTTTRDRVEQTTALGSSVSGRDVTLQAGTDAAQLQAEVKEPGRATGRVHRNPIGETRGGDLVVEGSSITAEGAATLTARGDVRISAAEQATTSAHDEQTIKRATGPARQVGRDLNMGLSTSNAGSPNVIGAALLGSGLATQANARTEREAVGSTISAAALAVRSGRDVAVQGSTLVADGDVSIAAARDLTITSTQNTAADRGSASSTRRGFVGQDGNVAIGVVRSEDSGRRQSTTQVQSQVASLEGNVSLEAGQRYTQQASSVLAAGDINITARSVDIAAGLDTASSTQTHDTSRHTRGGTVNVPIVEAVRAARNNREAANASGDSRLQTLAAMNSAIQISNAAANMVAGGTTYGARVGVALGQRQSHSETTQSGTQVVSSMAMAGRDLRITATGRDVTVTGSRLEAASDASLHADGALHLLAATGAAEQRSTNESSGASVGVSFGFGAQNGFAIELAANRARGNADGNDVTHANSRVNAGNTLRLSSGGDTMLRGAVASGQRVETDISGDLRIESLQDTTRFDARQSSSGFNMSLCIPPICYGAVVSGSVSVANARAMGDFASVTEQSAIRAGDSGFDVNVRGATSLVGGAITSTQAAIDADRNRMSTATLITQDIVNRDVFDARGVSVSAAYSSGQPSPNAGTPSRGGGANVSGAGLYTTDGEQTSTTQSGISAGTVTITNDAAQRVLAGRGAEAAVAALNRDVATGDNEGPTLTQAWNGNQLVGRATTGASVTQQFGANGARAVAEYGESQRRPINDAREADALRAQPERSDGEQRRLDQLEQRGYTSEGSRTTLADPALREQYERWGEGGAARVAAHVVVGALGGATSGYGAVQGAAGAGVSAAAAPQLDQLQADAYRQLREAGLSEAAARTISAAAGLTAATTLGAATGGAAGAMTALNQDANNRQLHRVETERIQQLARGDAEREARLTAAACALVRCADGVPTNDPAYAYLRGLQEAGAGYMAEQTLLRQQTGQIGRAQQTLFGYDPLTDSSLDWLSQNRVGTRAAGAVQAVGGAALIAAGSAGCTGGVGCTVGAVGVAMGVDHLSAGARTAVSGRATLTQGEQVLQSLGLSPQAAAVTYAIAGMGPAAVEAITLTRATGAAAQASQQARATYTGSTTTQEVASEAEAIRRIAQSNTTAAARSDHAILNASDEALARDLADRARIQPDTSRDAFYTANTNSSVLATNRFDMDHVLSGEINASGRATGYHAEFAADGAARITPGAAVTQNANGTYRAPVQVWDEATRQWVDKAVQSTFFPPSWSEARVTYEVTEAFRQGTPGTNFQAWAPSGLRIQFRWDPKNQRTTFFPTGQ